MAKKEKEEIVDQVETTETAEPTEVVEEVEKSEVDLLKEEISSKNDAFLRLMAEYDNFRKRTIKEKDSIRRDSLSIACETMLPVYDTLCVAVSQIEEESPHKKGVELTLKQLEDAFSKLSIERIEDSVGTAFDANLHNAVMHVEDENLEANVISETFQKGFKIGDKVIRYSTVKVAN